jgi:hypothetical protein
MFSNDGYIDPFDELVDLHQKYDSLVIHFNDLANAHNLLSGEVEKQANNINVLIQSIKVLQQSQIYLLEENDYNN